MALVYGKAADNGASRWRRKSVNRVHGVKCQKNLIFEIRFKFETHSRPSAHPSARIPVTFDIWRCDCSVLTIQFCLTVRSKNRYFRYTGLCMHFCATRWMCVGARDQPKMAVRPRLNLDVPLGQGWRTFLRASAQIACKFWRNKALEFSLVVNYFIIINAHYIVWLIA